RDHRLRGRRRRPGCRVPPDRRRARRRRCRSRRPSLRAPGPDPRGFARRIRTRATRGPSTQTALPASCEPPAVDILRFPPPSRRSNPPRVTARSTTHLHDLREGGRWTLAQSIKNDVLYALIRIALSVIRPWPARVLRAAGRALGSAAFVVLRRERRTAL